MELEAQGRSKSGLTNTLASYLPSVVTRRIASNPTAISEPSSESLSAALLFTDISSFSSLAERFALRGPSGTEELTNLLNDYFGRLISIASDNGGDVIKFAGDAMYALWSDPDEDLAVSTLRASQCAIAIQQALDGYIEPGGERLSMRIGVGAGNVTTIYVGGMYERWEFLLTGAPLEQMSSAEDQAKPGQIVLSPDAWSLVGEKSVGIPFPTGYVLLQHIYEAPSPKPINRIIPPPEWDSALLAYIPAAIRSRLGAGQTEWLAELRCVTVLVINVKGIDFEAPDALDRTQSFMYTMQRALYRYEGSVNKLLVDDKGTNLLVAFGLPPLAHEDDAVRGVMTAIEMQDRLNELRLEPKLSDSCR